MSDFVCRQVRHTLDLNGKEEMAVRAVVEDQSTDTNHWYHAVYQKPRQGQLELDRIERFMGDIQTARERPTSGFTTETWDGVREAAKEVVEVGEWTVVE